MSFCMYLRKSRADVEAEARGEGETLARHEKTLMDLAVRMGISVDQNAIYREIVSGETIAARPVMQKLLSEIEQGLWAGVLVVEVERLARGDTVDQGIVAQTFKYSNTKIITPFKTYDPTNEFDEQFFEFGLFMSRQEYRTINRRLQRGREMSVREGKYLGNIPPYGYRREKLERDKGFTLTPDPDESKVVRLVYDWFTGHDMGVTAIRNRLNAMRIPTRKGGAWSDESVRSILTNPVYTGKIRWLGRPQVKRVVNGEMVRQRPRAKEPMVVDGLHDALVDEETYRLAQNIFSANATPPVPGKRTLQNPLAGVVVCGTCGRAMIRRPYQNGYPDSLICIGPTCPNVSSHLYLVEDRLLKALETWLDEHRLEVEAGERGTLGDDLETRALQESMERVDSEIQTLDTQLSSLHDLLERGIYSVEVFMERTKVLNEKLATVKADRQALQEQLGQKLSRPSEQAALIPRVERVIETYRFLKSPEQKNSLLKEVIEKAVYTKDASSRGKIDGFDLVLYPRLSD